MLWLFNNLIVYTAVIYYGVFHFFFMNWMSWGLKTILSALTIEPPPLESPPKYEVFVLEKEPRTFYFSTPPDYIYSPCKAKESASCKVSVSAIITDLVEEVCFKESRL